MGPSDAALRWKKLNIQISQIKSEKLVNYRLRQIKIFGNLRPDEMKHVFPVNRISATVMPSRRKTWKFVSILLHCGLEIFVWSTLLQSHSEIYLGSSSRGRNDILASSPTTTPIFPGRTVYNLLCCCIQFNLFPSACKNTNLDMFTIQHKLKV